MNGSDLKEEIESITRYENAQKKTILIQAAEGTGTPVPSGNYTVKVGYPFETKFTENSEYCFSEWKAVSSADKTEITGAVSFSDPKSLSTQITLHSDVSGIQIIPVCVKRITLASEPSPKYETLGVSRDRSITIHFTKQPDENSFIFSATELPENAQPIKNNKDKIYAYKLKDLVYFKNISITNTDDISLAEHFLEPELYGTLLTIAVNKEKPIQLDTGSKFKTIKVSINGGIKDESGIKMNIEKSWKYQVTEKTDAQAYNVSVSAEKGTVNPNTTKDYSIGEKISLTYTEDDPDYKFIKWEYDPEIMEISDIKSKSATAVILEPATESSIKAICELKAEVESQTPEYSINGISLDEQLTIKFNKPLLQDDFEKSDFYEIVPDQPSLNYGSVNYCFEKPVLLQDKMTVLIKPNNDSLSQYLESVSLKQFYIFFYYSKLHDTNGYSLEELTDSSIQQVGKIIYTNKREDEKPKVTGKANLHSGIKKGTGSLLGLDNDYLPDYLSEIPFDSWTTDTIDSTSLKYCHITNHCQNRVHIESFNASDAKSGVKNLVIYEQLYKTTSGTAPVNPTVYEYRKQMVTDTTQGFYKLAEGFDYEFQTPSDGVLKLTLKAEDFAGNISDDEKIFYVIKDTVCDSDGILDTEMIDGSKAVTQDENSKMNLISFIPKIYGNNENRKIIFQLSATDETFAKNFISYSPIYFETNDGNTTGQDNTSHYFLFLEYGTDERNLTRSPIFNTSKTEYNSPEKRQVSVEMEPYKDWYLNVHVIDAVGNKAITKYCISAKNSDLIQAVTKDDSTTFYLDDETGELISYRFFYSTLSKQEDNSYAESSLVQVSENGNIQTSGDCSTTINNSKLTDAYRLYVQKIVSYSLKGKYVKTYCPMHLVYDSTLTSSTGLTKPSIEIESIEAGEVNSKKCTITINFKSGYNENLRYYLIDESNNSTPVIFENNKAIIEVESGVTSKSYYLLANNGISQAKSDSIYINTSDYDLTAPEATLGKSSLNNSGMKRNTFSFSYDGSSVLCTIADNTQSDSTNAGLNVDSNGKFTFDCYYTENENADFTNAKTEWPHHTLKGFTVSSDLSSPFNVYKKSNLQTAEYESAFRIQDFEDNIQYKLWATVYDKNSNCFDEIMGYGQISTIKALPQVSFDALNSRLDVSIADSTNNTSNYSATIMLWNNEIREWVPAAATCYVLKKLSETTTTTIYRRTFDSSSADNTFMTNKNVSFNLNTNADKTSYKLTGAFGNVELKDSFIKAVVRADLNYVDDETFKAKSYRSEDRAAFSYPAFLYIGDNNCSVKNLFASRYYVTVMSDKPCLVELIASKKNRGSELQDINEWERRGYKLNTEVLNLSSTKTMKNYSLDTSKVESGDYYVVVAHFADGSAAISNVYQK